MNDQWRHLTAKLPEWLDDCRQYAKHGEAASYIPELANAPADALGISILTPDGSMIAGGDSGLQFTMQSISKVFTLLLALVDHGEEHVFSKVGMEPTGDDFNSILKLELVEPGIPFNPLINAGAIAVSSLIKGSSVAERTERVLAFIRLLAGDDAIDYNEAVSRSESITAHRNRSLAYFLKENGVLDEQTAVEDVLSVYFNHCAIEVTCSHLARMGLILACGGYDPLSGRQLVPRRYVQIAKTFMLTCGMYNASGEFAIRAGIPAKSGVAGGILAVVPGQYGIGVVGPALNRKGNSIAGIRLLETMSVECDWSIF
ncbi:glutaminase A [Paenibacillus sp. MMS18-CY102]|uniref:glutaminase A n=1 Tax=Paenibacillus sp. MMS18-CY102 TaxID=2682849 RepID=UPI001366250A|nr:glutaminase A [Paenibacillus sp. MMS18-CY102]MWC28604.1 glutaminase A [Paenibacillus sp. MMS18-CY102]